MSKKKGSSGTKARNQRRNKPREKNEIDIDEAIEENFYIQRATQQVTEQYERKILEERNRNRREMQNIVDGRKFWVKPSLWDRIRGRFKDMYIVFNHMRAFHCTECGTNFHGLNYGIECMTLDLNTALSYIDECFEKYPNTRVKLLHVQVDRRTRRTGQIVHDYNYLMKDWDAEQRRYITEDLKENSAANKIFGELKESTSDYRSRKRRRRSEMP